MLSRWCTVPSASQMLKLLAQIGGASRRSTKKTSHWTIRSGCQWLVLVVIMLVLVWCH